MAVYSIKDLERLTGIKAHTIRIWEKRYGIVEPNRTQTNIRFYDDEDLKRLMNVSILNRNGLKISHIAEMTNEELADKLLQVSSPISDFETQIESLVVSMINLDEIRFEKILSSAMLTIGFETTLFNIIYPLFEKIGLLWQAGTITPAQEHFISNLIRQKLIVAIDGCAIVPDENTLKVLLYAPEWEFHEIGLLAYSFLVKKNNHHSVYLGQSVPFNNLELVVEKTTPDMIVTTMVTSRKKEEFEEYISKLAASFPDTPIIISGQQVSNLDIELPDNVRCMRSAQDFKALISGRTPVSN